MPRSRILLPVLIATLFLWPSSVHAQGKEQFVQGLVDFLTAVEGTHGNEGPAVVAAIQSMADGLAQWDAAVARVESGLAAEVGGAPPATAARMRGALATVYLDRGRRGDALAQLDMAASLDPSSADVHALRGLVLEQLNRPREAADAYRRAWQSDRNSPAHAYRFLRSSSPSSDTADAGAALKVLLAAVADVRASMPPLTFPTSSLLDDASVPNPEFALARYAGAFALIQEGKYGEAVSRLRAQAATDPLVSDAGRSSPASSEAHRVLGIAHATASQAEKSLEELRTAVRLDAGNERARIALADVLVTSKDAAGARVFLSETTQVIPESGQAHWKLGRVHLQFGDEANAVRSFESAARLAPFAGAGLLQASIGRLDNNRLDFDAAAAAYARRIALTPNDSAAHLDLADIYRAQDKLDAALAESLVAALIDPSSARSFATIGQIHAVSGRDDDAVQALRKAVALDPAHLEAHYALSRALSRLNRADEARQELEIFAQLQTKAMADERRLFQDNQLKIEETLKTVEPKDQRR
ncbi:MAG TPA: tetratricopeptide repeat protein [Vicinamibacterales bacterium]|jgi:tetratricopeptide (TPR) repeat protein